MNAFFDFGGLTPHGFCLAWQPGLIWLTAASNLLIAAGYFSFLVALFTLLLRWRNAPYKSVIGLFAAFIVACGTAHVLATVTLWMPLYWISGAVDAMTAVLSVMTGIAVWPVIGRILSSERALQAALSVAEVARRRLEDLAMKDGLTGLANPSYSVRAEGAHHQWRKVPPGELSITPVADERFDRVTGRAEAS